MLTIVSVKIAYADAIIQSWLFNLSKQNMSQRVIGYMIIFIMSSSPIIKCLPISYIPSCFILNKRCVVLSMSTIWPKYVFISNNKIHKSRFLYLQKKCLFYFLSPPIEQNTYSIGGHEKKSLSKAI